MIGRGEKILVVEDSYVMRKQLVAVLEGAGYNVVTAEDGRDGLEQLHKNDDVELIISDYHMPKLSGLEFLKTLRSKGLNLPFLMLTTEVGKEFVKTGKELGLQAWMFKPFKPDILVAAVDKLLNN